jgi:nitrite reductase/ring-hydroxylating ferredoxin subunit
MQRDYLKIFPVTFILISLMVLFSTCNKNDDPIPNAYVNLFLGINSTQYVELNSIGGWVNVTGGVRGIVVYRKSLDEFVAFERNCPYQPSNDCARIQVESSGVTAIDSCCGSRFILIDGSIVNGPATISLKQYNTSFDGVTLHIYN